MPAHYGVNDPSTLAGVEAVFFGTVVDWRGSLRTNLDDLQRQSLDHLVAEQKIAGLTEEDLRDITHGWHRLEPWPDALDGLHRLKQRYLIGPLSNGNTALLVNMVPSGEKQTASS